MRIIYEKSTFVDIDCFLRIPETLLVPEPKSMERVLFAHILVQMKGSKLVRVKLAHQKRGLHHS